MSYQSRVYHEQGGDRLVAASGGSIDVESGGEIDVESGASLKLAGTTMSATAAELNALNGVTAGTVTASKAIVAGAAKDIDALTLTAGAAAAAVAQRFGASATEGLEIKVIDEDVSLASAGAKYVALTDAVPAGAVILSVQANVEALVVAGGTTVKVGVGLNAGDMDKYGKTSDLTQNQKIDTIPDWAVLGGEEQLDVCGVVTNGSTLGDSNLTAGTVRVRVVYLVPNSLDDA